MSLHATKFAWVAAGMFAVGAVTGWSAPTLLRTAGAAAAVLPASTSDAYPSAIPPGTAPDYRAIFARNEAAVVRITTVGETKVAASQFFGAPFGFDPFAGGNDGNGDNDGNNGNGGNNGNSGNDSNNPFFQFFRGMPGPRSDTVPVRALGSGFIINPDGLILTNAHVVNGAQQVTVTLSDRRQYRAKVLGADRSSDIAVLKIDAHDLPTARLGNSEQLSVGDYVMAIGAPFGLQESATAGIVSAKGRSLPNSGYVSFIQTDAAVNPGNSGGPLFNASGAVIGITSEIYTNSGGYQGVSFAIPIALAEQVEGQIVKTGRVEHGRLGVQVQDVDQSLAGSFGLKGPGGALVAEVEPDSAAARAGVMSGDVILKYDGSDISDAAALSMHVNTTPPGSRATLQVWRAGKPITLTATIGSAGQLASNAQLTPASDQVHLGLTLRPLTQDEREQVGVTHGLVVESAQGHAAAAGIQQGDVVLAVNGTAVNSVPQLRELLHQRDQQIALLIQRGHQRIFIPVALG